MNTQLFFRNVSLDAQIEWRKQMRNHNQTLNTLQPIKFAGVNHLDVAHSRGQKLVKHSNEQYAEMKRRLTDNKAFTNAFNQRGKPVNNASCVERQRIEFVENQHLMNKMRAIESGNKVSF